MASFGKKKKGKLNEQLRVAYLNGDMDSVNYLLNRGENINALDDHGWSLLYIAAMNDDLEGVQYFIEKGANINAKNVQGLTALMVSSAVGALDVVLFLIEHGAQINVKDTSGKTAIIHASEEGQQEIVDLLNLTKKNLSLKKFQTIARSARRTVKSRQAQLEKYTPLPSDISRKIAQMSLNSFGNKIPSKIKKLCKKLKIKLSYKRGTKRIRKSLKQLKKEIKRKMSKKVRRILKQKPKIKKMSFGYREEYPSPYTWTNAQRTVFNIPDDNAWYGGYDAGHVTMGGGEYGTHSTYMGYHYNPNEQGTGFYGNGTSDPPPEIKGYLVAIYNYAHGLAFNIYNEQRLIYSLPDMLNQAYWALQNVPRGNPGNRTWRRPQ